MWVGCASGDARIVKISSYYTFGNNNWHDRLITNCKWCPHADDGYHYGDVTKAFCRCKGVTIKDSELDTIPAWCQLDNYNHMEINNEHSTMGP